MTRARILADYVSSGDELALKAPLASPTFTGTTTVSGDIVPSTPLSNRNMIINGGMQVWQRATTATATTGGYTTVDRWQFEESSDGAYTSEKHSMSLAELNTTGHATALKLLVTGTDTSIAAGQYAYFYQNIEAQNLQHLQYGTANAKTVTASFWIKSNLTGTYCLTYQKADSTAYKIPINFTIDSADTWEQKKITITPTAGSTSLITGANGIVNNDNGLGIRIGIGLTWGSTYNGGTNNTWTASNHFATSSQVNWLGASNNLYITGVQLELGSNATPFEHRSYTEEFFKCNRYYANLVTANDYTAVVCFAVGPSTWYGQIQTPNAMRDTPAVEWGGSGNWTTIKSQTSGVSPSSSTAPTIAKWVDGQYHVILNSGANFTGLTDGGGPYIATFGSTRTLALNAEL